MHEQVTGRLVLLASPRGFCAGVERAVRTVELALERFGAPVYVRGQIVHNTSVVRDLERRGALFIEELGEVPEGATVVFSAHGVAPAVRKEAVGRRLNVIDATCPLVTKVHKEARRLAATDYEILLIGHAGHEEVIGTTGEAPSRIRLVDGLDGVAEVTVRDPGKVAWLSQTTLSMATTGQIVDALRERYPELKDPPSDDICYATQNRQTAVKDVAGRAELVLVVGSSNSSNSQRLVDVALASGAGAAYLVDTADGIDPRWLEDITVVGLTSGASVPDALVDDMLGYLAARGFDRVEHVAPVRERMVFSLPAEVRGVGDR